MVSWLVSHLATPPAHQSDYNDGFVTLNLTLGVTSNLTDGKGKTFLKVDDPQVYKPASYGDTMNDGVKDSGNISLVDSLHYQLVFNDAVQVFSLE